MGSNTITLSCMDYIKSTVCTCLKTGCLFIRPFKCIFIYLFIHQSIHSSICCLFIDPFFVRLLYFSLGDITRQGFEKKKAKLIAPYINTGQHVILMNMCHLMSTDG